MILERQCRLRSLPFWFRVTLGIRSVKRLPIGGARPIVRSPAIAGVMGVPNSFHLLEFAYLLSAGSLLLIGVLCVFLSRSGHQRILYRASRVVRFTGMPRSGNSITSWPAAATCGSIKRPSRSGPATSC